MSFIGNMFFNRETLTGSLSRMATSKRNLLALALCLLALSHMLAQASSPLAAKPTTKTVHISDQFAEESKKAVKYMALEVEEPDKGGKMSTELMMATPKMDLSPPPQPPPMSSKLDGTELMMAPKMDMVMEVMEPMKSMKPRSEVSMIIVPKAMVKDHAGAQMMEDLTEAAGHKKYMLVKKKPKMKKIKMEVYKPKMKYKKIKMKVPVKKMKKKKVKGYMVKKHHEHY